MDVRAPQTDDVIACVDLVEARRELYQTFEPRFWNKAAGSRASTTDWFKRLFTCDQHVCLVAVVGAKVVGFLIACEIPVPPVYNPGGRTALIDDFCVADGRWCEVGTALLARAKEQLCTQGYTQIVVVGADKDTDKTAFLRDADLSLASTWWTASF